MGLFGNPKRNPAPPKEATPEPEKKPEAAPLTRDDVQAMVSGAVEATASQLHSVISDLRAGIDTLASRQPVVMQAPVAQHAELPITDEDIDNAVASGQGAARLVRNLLDRQARDISVGFDRKLNEVVEFGVNAIANLTAETLKQLPHYSRFKKEIDTKLGALTPAMRSNPDTLKLIYNSVVGEHTEELSKEARETALRQANEGGVPGNEIDVRSPGGVGKPGGGAIGKDRPSVQTVEEFAGKEGLMALQHKGRGGLDGDAYAQTLGYKDWAHMQTQYQQLLAENGDA